MKSETALLSGKSLLEAIQRYKSLQKPLQTVPARALGLSSVNSLTTRPIAIPSVDPGLKGFRKLVATGKGYVSLYKNGIKHVWNNQKTVNELKRKYRFRNIAELSQCIVNRSPPTLMEPSVEKSTEKSTNSHIHSLTRADYQLILRTRKDIRKLPPFAVIFAIFFECTPLIVLMFPRITPMTCYTPSAQRSHDLQRDKNVRALHDLEKQHLNPVSSSSQTAQLLKEYSRSVYNMSPTELQLLAKFSGKTSSIVPISLYRISTLQAKVVDYLTEIRCDNELLLRSLQEFTQLDEYETANACLDRAIAIHKKTPAQMKADLLRWIISFKENRLDAGLLLHDTEGLSEEVAEQVLRELK